MMLCWYLLIINVLAFVCYGLDKFKAKRNAPRVSERTLLLLALVGGGVGAWLGMLVWRHKTKHAKFRFGVPILLLLQAALYWWIIVR
jgi:uncharacterized membrane protein YsdA (DUF1294 family)